MHGFQALWTIMSGKKKLNYDMLFTQLGTFFDAFKIPALQKEL